MTVGARKWRWNRLERQEDIGEAANTKADCRNRSNRSVSNPGMVVDSVPPAAGKPSGNGDGGSGTRRDVRYAGRGIIRRGNRLCFFRGAAWKPLSDDTKDQRNLRRNDVKRGFFTQSFGAATFGKRRLF